MKQFIECILSDNLEYIIRLLISVGCGMLIGFERKNRNKEAGIRTHVIVALASCLMMIISKYGFSDLEINSIGTRGADPARIAAQIVTGVGFLGAGMIFVHKNSIKGLTTAAGIWATSGIGMAVGSGMYFIGITATVLVVILQIFLHSSFKIFQNHLSEDYIIHIKNTESSFDTVKKILDETKYPYEITSVSKRDELIIIGVEISHSENCSICFLIDKFTELDEVTDIRCINN